jgi:AcrR family transcriptional regulator
MKKVTGRLSLEMQVQHEAHVLNIAFKEFIAHGFKGTSLDAIARRAEVSRVTLYRRYHGKVGLFVAVGEHAVERLSFDLQHIETQGRQAPAVLEDFLATAYDAATKRETIAIVRMAIAERNEFPELAHTIRENRTKFLQPLTDYLEELANKKLVSLSEPGAVAAERLMDLCLSFYSVMLVGPLKTARERRDASRQAVEFFLKGCGYAEKPADRRAASSRRAKLG